MNSRFFDRHGHLSILMIYCDSEKAGTGKIFSQFWKEIRRVSGKTAAKRPHHRRAGIRSHLWPQGRRPCRRGSFLSRCQRGSPGKARKNGNQKNVHCLSLKRKQAASTLKTSFDRKQVLRVFSENLSARVLQILDSENISYEAAAELCDMSSRNMGNIVWKKVQPKLFTIDNRNNHLLLFHFNSNAEFIITSTEPAL